MKESVNIAEQIVIKILQECYVSYSHNRQDLLVIDGIIDWTPEEDTYIEELAKREFGDMDSTDA